MNIRAINGIGYNNTAFSGKIIDSHAHTGGWLNGDYNVQMLDVFIKEPLNVDINGSKQTDIVDKMLVSNLECMDDCGGADEMAGNIEMLDICKENPKLYPLAVCQPGKTNGNPQNIRKLLDLYEGEFVGLKFHPECLPLNANDFRYDSYLDLAEEKGLPCLFHCEDGNSSPEAIYELAKRHPNVPVIMAHLGAGGEWRHKRAIDVLMRSVENNDANLYADISWVDWENDLPSYNPRDVVDVIRKLDEKDALNRLLFGTDAPLGCYGGNTVYGVSPKDAYEMTLSRTKSAIAREFPEKADDIIQKVFYTNAEELFF